MERRNTQLCAAPVIRVWAHTRGQRGGARPALQRSRVQRTKLFLLTFRKRQLKWSGDKLSLAHSPATHAQLDIEMERLFKSFEEDEERTKRLAAALEHESTATSLHFALFPRKTRDGGLQPTCREPVVSMMVCACVCRVCVCWVGCVLLCCHHLCG